MASIDFTQTEGRIKPLHGINNSPVKYNGELPELKDAGIPYVRLHDAGGPFGGTYLVDIPNIFPDFDADASSPDSYDFAYTDAYFRTLAASGLKIFYRLGVTIENNYHLKPQRIYPPQDFRKWAEICCGVIRHYNEGWANGFHYEIEYWEIWNEPESPGMWQGTSEQFCEMYATAARILRERFKDIKIGGYGASGFFAITRPNQNKMRQGYLTFFDGFIDFMKKNRDVPFDFFTWHLYSKEPGEVEAHAQYVRKRLDDAGFASTESIFGEWNYIEHDTCAEDQAPWDALRSNEGAAYVAAVFSLLQKAPVDMALFYDAFPARIYCGLYMNPEYMVSKTYYAFKAFNALFQLGTAVHTEIRPEEEEIYALGARNESGTKGAMLFANRERKVRRIALECVGMKRMKHLLVLDDDRVMTEVNWLLKDGWLTMPPLSVMLLFFDNG